MNAHRPSTASTLGLGDQFQYWHGASGRRYLFTAIPVDTVEEYRHAVVVLAHKGRRSTRRAIWIGELDGTGRRRGRRLIAGGPRPNLAFIHLLAGGPNERAAVISDLEAGLGQTRAA